MIKRLRRITPTTVEETKNVQNFPEILRKTQKQSKENLNVSGRENEVYKAEFPINQNLDKVYNFLERERTPYGEPAAGDADTGGTAVWQTGPAEGRPGEAGGRDSAAAPRFGEAGDRDSAAAPRLGEAGGRDSAAVPPPGPSAQVRMAGSGGTEGTAEPASAVILPAAAGEAEWAEQADRAFRRDSRRYDGGFYLY